MSQSTTASGKSVSMDADKRGRILNAALGEFCKGFKNASTDSIVEQAGISKGLLFHYFGSKKGLLDYLFDYSADLILTGFSDKVDYSEPDLLDKLWQMTMIQLALSYQHPALFDFLQAVERHDEPEFAPYKERLETLFAAWYPDDETLIGQSDLSIFREGVDPRRAVTAMRLTLGGYTDIIIGNDKSMNNFRAKYNDILDGLEEYIALFRNAFYA